MAVRVVRGFLLVLGLAAGPIACSAPNSARARTVAPRLSDGLAEFQEAERQRSLGTLPAAGDQYRVAADLASRYGNRSLEVECLVKAGECQLQAGLAKESGSSFATALDRAGRMNGGDPVASTAQLRAHTGLGDLDFASGRFVPAGQHYQKALDLGQGPARDSILYRQMLLAEATGKTADAASLRKKLRNPDDPRMMTLRRAFQKYLRAPPAPAVTRKPSADPGENLRNAGLDIVPRSAWNAAAPDRSDIDPMGRIWRITVHHSADDVGGYGRGETAKEIRAMQRYHMNQNGWADIGYHFLIDGTGRIWQGRALDFQGAHAGNNDLNAGNVGVVLLGDFSHSPAPSVQTERLIELLGVLCARFEIPRSQVHSHQEYKVTTCPGPFLQRLVNRYRARG